MKHIIYIAIAVVSLVLLIFLVKNLDTAKSGGSNGDLVSESTETIGTEIVDGDVTETTESEVVEESEAEGSETEQPESEQPEVVVPQAPTPTPAPPPEMYSSASGYLVYDPHNTRGLSNVRSGYAYGIATNEQPGQESVSAQRRWENMGIKGLSVDLKSTEKVLYLTFSCGYEYNDNTKKILDVLKEKGVTAAFFCDLSFYRANPQLTQRFIDEGHILGNHSATHPDFPALSRDGMANEVYRVDQYLKETYGYECRYFRYPGGYYSENALDLVAGLGHKIVFWSVAYRDWEVENLRGADYAFQTVTSRLHPGAVIVLHAVCGDNAEAMGAIIDYAREQGYTFKSLDEYSW